MIHLGHIEQFRGFPTPVAIEDLNYFLIKDNGSFYLLSAICPHAGWDVELKEDCFECPTHQWRFHFSGESINVKDKRLFKIPVLQVGNDLYVERVENIAREGVGKGFISKIRTSIDCEITLHAHACAEIKYKGFSLLTDPWLLGPAFMGAWMPYPTFKGNVESIQPSAIFISHEHSDHLNEHTLSFFNKGVPMFFPDFPNGRIQIILKKLGFNNLNPLPFGARHLLADHLAITIFEPASLWNDSILLVELDGFNILNLNDAGINHKIKGCISHVDMVMSTFSPGASGFPATWVHLSDEQKIAYYEKARVGQIKKLLNAMRFYEAKYLLPFASHFVLWHPQQRKYNGIVRKNRVMDIKNAFAEEDFEVIDLLPGEKWQSKTGRFGRIYTEKERDRLYHSDVVARSIEKSWNAGTFHQYHPESSTISQEDSIHYLLDFNKVPQIIFCESLVVEITVLECFDGLELFRVKFEVMDNTLKILSDEDTKMVNQIILIPQQVLSRIIHDNLSWDEAHIGYWCKFDRNPDLYYTGFWRLLQAPYYKRKINGSFTPIPNMQRVHRGTNIQELLEKHPPFEKILRRHGMYCGSCGNGFNETLEQGAKFHGLDESKIIELMNELNAVEA